MNLLNRFNGPVRFAIGILLIGVMFKVMHWTGGNLITSIAFGLILVLYGAKVVNKKKRIPLDFIKLILIGFWCIQGVLKINHLPYSSIFIYGFWITVAVWLILEVFLEPEEVEERTKN